MIYIKLFLPAILSAIAMILAAVRYKTRRKMQWAITYFVATGVYVLGYKPLGGLTAFNLTSIAAAITAMFMGHQLEKTEREKAEAAEAAANVTVEKIEEPAEDEEKADAEDLPSEPSEEEVFGDYDDTIDPSDYEE